MVPLSGFHPWRHPCRSQLEHAFDQTDGSSSAETLGPIRLGYECDRHFKPLSWAHLELDEMVNQMQIYEAVFARHGSKVPVSQSRDSWSGVVRLSKEEGFKLVHRHGSQYLRKVDRLHLIEDLFQLRWNHLLTLTRITVRESRASNFRSPTQGLWKEVLDVT